MRIFIALVASVLLAQTALARGVEFHQGRYEEALAAAKKANKNVLVDVHAQWCPPCKKQKAEVFGTDEGLALTQNLVSWRVDFDDDKTKHLMKKWNILSLPTVLFLRPDGTEIDRIEGYESKAEFIKEAAQKAKGFDSLPALEASYQKSSGAKKAQALVQMSHRYLVRGVHEKGLAGLERATLLDENAAQDALFFMGRYFSRVEGDYEQARHIWRELYQRFPKGKYAVTAAWWYAGAVHELGHDELGLALFAQHARSFPEDSTAGDLVVSFAEEGKFKKRQAVDFLREHQRAWPAKEHAALEVRVAKLP